MNDYVNTQPSNKFITKFKEFSSNCKFIGHGTWRFVFNSLVLHNNSKLPNVIRLNLSLVSYTISLVML